MKKEMNVYFHVCLINDGLLIAIELLHSLHMSNLLYKSKSVNIGIKYKSKDELETFKRILYSHNISGNINILYEEDNDLNNKQELSTAIYFKNYADSLKNSDEYICYIHTKGLSHINTFHENPTRFWRYYIEYFMINKWKDCVSVLDGGFESCGTYGYDMQCMRNHLIFYYKEIFLDNTNNMKYYPGTFYWMNTSLIKRIPIKYFYNDTEYHKWSIEALPGLIEHKQYIFSSPNPHDMNLYNTVLHPLQYNHL
jgi:hypothetical protein